MKEPACRIPLSATIVVEHGQAKMVSAEWADVPADLIARFLIEKFGADAIFGGGEDAGA